MTPKNAYGHLVPGDISAARWVDPKIARPNYVGKKRVPRYTGSDIYNKDEIERVRAAGSIASQTLDYLAEHIRAGITTDELDRLAHEFITSKGAYPSPLGYQGFPKSICTSINEVICHGIPDNTVLEDCDIVNVDITAFFEGMHGDTNRTFIIGNAPEATKNLVKNTEEALHVAIKAVAPGRRVNVIGLTIERLAKRFNYGVVREFTGHGVGRAFHTGLVIPHYDATPYYDRILKPGMIFTIEPMLNLGTRHWNMWEDGWTAVTKDLLPSAQFEHTIVVTQNGAEILTLS